MRLAAGVPVETGPAHRYATALSRLGYQATEAGRLQLYVQQYHFALAQVLEGVVNRYICSSCAHSRSSKHTSTGHALPLLDISGNALCHSAYTADDT